MEGVELDGDGDDQDGDSGEGLGLELYETRFRRIPSHDWFDGQGGDREGPREHKVSLRRLRRARGTND